MDWETDYECADARRRYVAWASAFAGGLESPPYEG